MAASPDVTQRLMSWARVEYPVVHRPPAWWRVALSTVLSVVLSLAADAALVFIGTRLFPATKGYVHFAFSDYSKLTIVGVLIACAAWPVTTRVTSRPRWMFTWMAVLVTLVLWLPDVYILVKGQPATAVAFLFVMHLAIALVTYNALVYLAPVRARQRAPRIAQPTAR